MNLKANEVLTKLRAHLESEVGAPNAREVKLSEAEMEFCEEGVAFLNAKGLELENFESPTPDDVINALELVAEDNKELAPEITELLSKWQIIEA